MADTKNKLDRDDEPVREGDILGLGGAVVPKSPMDKTRSNTADEHGPLHDNEEAERNETAYRRRPGATGIDMGAGGSGTDVE
jgi:hypothetical protein